MKKLFLILAMTCLWSCDFRTDPRINSKEVNETIRSRKIKHVTDAQILEDVMKKGQIVAQNLKVQIEKLSNPCGFQDVSTLDSLNKRRIVRLEIACEPQSDWTEKELQVWQAYQEGFASSAELSENVQKLGEKLEYKEILFSQPIYYQDNANKKLGMLSIVFSRKELIKDFKF